MHAAHLPPELITQIVHYAFEKSSSYSRHEDTFLGTYNDPDLSTLERMRDLQNKIYPLLRVNRTWRDALFLLLYRRPILVSPRSMQYFFRSCQSKPGVILSLEELILMDVRSGEAMESIYGLALTSDTNVQPVSDILEQLCAMKDAESMSVIFVSRRWPLLKYGASGREPFVALPVPVQIIPIQQSGALYKVHTLTLHGYTSRVLLSASTHIFNLPNLSLHCLRQLTINSIIMTTDILDWPLMPVLTTLTISECSLSGVLPPNFVPSPTSVPNLHTLAIVQLSSKLLVTDPHTITFPLLESLIAHGGKLTSLTVPSFVYYGLFTRKVGSAEEWSWKSKFPILRELATTKPQTRVGWVWSMSDTQEPWTKRLLPNTATLPATLALLRVVGVWPCPWEVLILFDYSQAERVLAPARILERDSQWTELRIAGDVQFWDQVPTNVLWHVRRACLQRQELEFVDDVYNKNAGMLASRDRLPSHRYQ
jgi:hypothetical protein